MVRRFELSVLSLTLVLAGHPAQAADWPQFRGLQRDGVSGETGLLRTWPADGPKVVWRRPIGEGFSTVAVVGDRLYTMDSDDKTEYALCLEAATGKEVWRTPMGPKFVDDMGNGPRTTPTIDGGDGAKGGTVYVLGAKGLLAALKASDGSRIWSVDLPATFGSKVPTWGYSSSPLIDGDILVMEVGGAPGKALVAFNKADGTVKWTARDGDAAYASPVVMTIGGVRQYVFSRRAGPETVSLSPSGEVLWAHAGPPTVINMPMFIPPDKVYISAGDDGGAQLLRVKTEGGKTTAEELWKTRGMKNHFHGSILAGDHLYGFDNGTFKCIAAATGEQTWAYRGLGKGSLLLADGLLYVFSDRGDLVLVEPNPTAYTEKSRFKVTDGKAWTSPTLAGGRMYVRDQDELVCLDLQAPKGVAS